MISWQTTRLRRRRERRRPSGRTRLCRRPLKSQEHSPARCAVAGQLLRRRAPSRRRGVLLRGQAAEWCQCCCSSEAAARPALNATPRLSGLQKSPCLPTSGRFSGRQASCRQPFVLPKRNVLVSVTSAGSRAGRRAAGGQRLGICARAGNATVQRRRTRDRRVVVGSQGRQPINHDRALLGIM